MNDLLNNELRFADSIIRVLDTDNTIIAGNDHALPLAIIKLP